MSNKLNILISISHLSPGGAQVSVARLASELSNRHSVYLYDYELWKTTKKDHVLNILSDNVKIIKMPPFLDWIGKKIDTLLNRHRIRIYIWFKLKSLHFRLVLLRYHINVINTHLYHSDNFVTSILRNTRYPVVLTDCGDYRFVVEENVATLAEVQAIFKRVNYVIFKSESNKKILNNFYFNSVKSCKIYNGFSIENQKIYQEKLSKNKAQEKPEIILNNNDFVFGMVARGIPEKGWFEAITAFRVIHQKSNRRLRFILVGGSEYLNSLQQDIDVELKPFIDFVGYSSEPMSWVNEFDVALLPSHFSGESLPNAVIEYLALGKPVIATAIGGIPEMLDVGGQLAGVLINLDDHGRVDVNALADAMLAYSQDESLLKYHADLAPLAFEKFRLETSVKQYEQLFRELYESPSN